MVFAWDQVAKTAKLPTQGMLLAEPSRRNGGVVGGPFSKGLLLLYVEPKRVKWRERKRNLRCG
jgi:hypothetical protein